MSDPPAPPSPAAAAAAAAAPPGLPADGDSGTEGAGAIPAGGGGDEGDDGDDDGDASGPSLRRRLWRRYRRHHIRHGYLRAMRAMAEERFGEGEGGDGGGGGGDRRDWLRRRREVVWRMREMAEVGGEHPSFHLDAMELEDMGPDERAHIEMMEFELMAEMDMAEMIRRRRRREERGEDRAAPAPRPASAAAIPDPPPPVSDLEALCRALQGEGGGGVPGGTHWARARARARARAAGAATTPPPGEEEDEASLLARIERTEFPSDAMSIRAVCGSRLASPLHVAASMGSGSGRCTDAVFEALIERCPRMASLRDDSGDTPCERMWRKFLESLRNRVALVRAQRLGRKLLDRNAELRTLLVRLDLLLRAVEGGGGGGAGAGPAPAPGREEGRKPRARGDRDLTAAATRDIVHRSLEHHRAAGVASDLLNMLFRLFPEQLLRPGAFGRRATSAPALAPPRSRAPSRALPLHRASSDPTVKAEVLIDAARARPVAASYHDEAGRLPLALAIEAGRTWDEGVSALAMAATDALGTRDAGTGLFPFMLAATVDADLDTVFMLLSSCPQQVRVGIPV